MRSNATADGGGERLRFLLEVVALEAQHLAETDQRLFVAPMTKQRAESLASNVALAEQVDAFVARFGRLQDTVADKLLPALLEGEAERTGTVIDNLARAERLGWLRSVDDWLVVRKLRNRMIHEYVRDSKEMAAAPTAAHVAVPLLLETAAALVARASKGTEALGK